MDGMNLESLVFQNLFDKDQRSKVLICGKLGFELKLLKKQKPLMISWG